MSEAAAVDGENAKSVEAVPKEWYERERTRADRLEAQCAEMRGLLVRARIWIEEPEHMNHAKENARRERQRKLLEEIGKVLLRPKEPTK